MYEGDQHENEKREESRKPPMQDTQKNLNGNVDNICAHLGHRESQWWWGEHLDMPRLCSPLFILLESAPNSGEYPSMAKLAR
jgi:hypothetical protein